MSAPAHRFPLTEALLDAAALVLPVECAGCGRPDRAVCSECRAALRPRLTILPGELRVAAGAPYEHELRSVLLAFKDGDRPGLARVLAPVFAVALTEALRVARTTGGDDGLVLCPIPTTPAARRRRGFRPVERLAHAVGVRGTRLLVAAPRAEHRSQKTVGERERSENVRGAFRASSRAAGCRVVLLDDVVTTGATLREAAREIERAGATVVSAAVLAATPRRILNRKETPTELPPTDG